MKKIQMVDLKGQYNDIKDVVNPSIQEVIETTAFVNGPQVHKFQSNLEQYLGCKTRYSMCQWYRCITNCHDGVRFKTR